LLTPVGFWSYARQDDNHSDGQLSELRAIVGKAINLRRGEEVRLFQDTEAIPIGADWEATIESTIAQTTFFIPLVTPRFLKSEHCRDEFKAFRRRMAAMGRHFSRGTRRHRPLARSTSGSRIHLSSGASVSGHSLGKPGR